VTKITRSIVAALFALSSFTVSGAQTPRTNVDGAAADEEPVEFSEAERRMWMTDQLASIDEPMVITYHFERGGSYEPGFEDKVEFRISKVKEDGMKAASLNFFTGERNFPIPPVDSTNVNPVLGVYLQGDVYEMNRLTDERGQAKERWRYFHRQIKHALASDATVTATEITFDGEKYDAHRITFSPYVNDPHRDEFEKFADKRYSVVVSDALPGYVYEIETIVPGEDENFDDPLITERLRLKAVTPLPTQQSS